MWLIVGVHKKCVERKDVSPPVDTHKPSVSWFLSLDLEIQHDVISSSPYASIGAGDMYERPENYLHSCTLTRLKSLL